MAVPIIFSDRVVHSKRKIKSVVSRKKQKATQVLGRREWYSLVYSPYCEIMTVILLLEMGYLYQVLQSQQQI